MNWHFTETDDDSRNLTDASQHTVQSHGGLTQLQIFIREDLQNHLDNRAESSTPVRVDYQLSYLSGPAKNSFLEALRFAELRSHIEAVREFELKERGTTALPDPKKILAKDYRLRLLFIDDYGTRGLVGPEHNREKERHPKPHCFLGLCRNVGDSQKGDETLGGTYGFGKTVLWKHSRLKLVMFYSRLGTPYSKETGGSSHGTRFFGQVRLTGHDLGNQGFRGEGFFGNREANLTWSLFDREADICAQKLCIKTRDAESAGTCILVVDFDDPEVADEAETEEGTAAAIRDAAELYYWPAIADGKLLVRSRGLSQEDGPWMQADPLARAPLVPFIKAYRAARSNETSEGMQLKLCPVQVPKGPKSDNVSADSQLVVATSLKDYEPDADPKYVNYTALMRGAGMVVGYKRFPRKGLGGKDFYGVVLGGRCCPNSGKGGDAAQARCEQLLGWSEPVTHDNWTHSSDRLKGWWGASAEIKRVMSRINEALSAATTAHAEPEGQAAALLSALFPLTDGETASNDRDMRVEIISPPQRMKVEGTNVVKFGFTIRVRVPSRQEFKSKIKPDSWRIECGYGFCGEGRRRRIVLSAPLRLTGFTKNDDPFVEIKGAHGKNAIYEAPVDESPGVWTFKGETDALDQFVANTGKHELEVKVEKFAQTSEASAL